MNFFFFFVIKPLWWTPNPQHNHQSKSPSSKNLSYHPQKATTTTSTIPTPPPAQIQTRAKLPLTQASWHQVATQNTAQWPYPPATSSISAWSGTAKSWNRASAWKSTSCPHCSPTATTSFSWPQPTARFVSSTCSPTRSRKTSSRICSSVAYARLKVPSPEIGNLVIDNSKLIETITLPITIGNWHYSKIRVIGNVVDSITEPRKKQLQLLFIMTCKKYKFIRDTKSNFISDTKYCF